MEECAYKSNLCKDEDAINSIAKQIPTKVLINEIIRREGVEIWSVDEDDSYSLRIAHMSFKSFSTRKDVGPTRILIINDQEERIYGRSYNST